VRAVAAARGGRSDISKIVVGIVVAAAVVGGVLFEQHKAGVAAQTLIPARIVPGSTRYPVSDLVKAHCPA
jgi:hypothetical protein